MKAKYIITAALVLLVAGAILGARLVSKDEEPAPAIQEEASEAPTQIVSDNKAAFDLSSYGGRAILAVYFHGNIRCATCLEIEKMARDTVTSEFAGENGLGVVSWAAVNYDVPENDRYNSEFEFQAPSLILMEVENGKALRWRNLADTWDLVNDRQAFSKYVFDETADFINQGS
jgi:hypothetical protein